VIFTEEVKAKWIDALRSGKYEQGRGQLRSKDDEYCCLGVLLDILSPDAWVLNTEHGCYQSLDDRISVLPNYIENEIGRQGELIDMNDGGKSFTEIADWIQENVTCSCPATCSNTSTASDGN
jgi:hypothetical protein